MSSYDKQDVPTAAKVYGKWIDADYDEHWNISCEREKLVKDGDELVRRSDHEERVEQARNEIRREILDNIEEFEDSLEDRRERVYRSYERDNDEIGWDDWHAVEDRIDAKVELLDKLRYEVSSE